MKCAYCQKPLSETFLCIEGFRFCDWTCKRLFHPVFNLQKFREEQGGIMDLTWKKRDEKVQGINIPNPNTQTKL